jgi:rhodanese-related sulfurtransferase
VIQLDSELSLPLLVVVLILSLFFIGRHLRWRRCSISIQQLYNQLQRQSRTVVLDVRNESEFRGALGHIEGAINIPLASLSERSGELLPHAGKLLAIICHTDNRSRSAARLLATLPFKRIVIVRMGMVAWSRAGLPVVR